MATAFIFYTFAGLAIFFALQAGYRFWKQRASRRSALVRQRLAIDEEEADQQILVMDGGAGRNALDEMLRDTSTYLRLRDLLEQAGDKSSPGEFLLKSLLWGLVPAVAVGLLTLSAPGAVLGALGGLVPTLLLLRQRSQRMSKIDLQLPVALEVMTISLRAGHSLAQTIHLTSRELRPPLRDEFQRCAEEHSLGRPVEETLVAMSKRLPACRALRTFVVAVLVLQQTGGNIIEIIERIIETLRMQSQHERKLAAMTAEGKSSARMLAFMPLAFMALAYLADPSYIGLLFTDPFGTKMLFVCIVLWLIGLVWTRKLVNPST